MTQWFVLIILFYGNQQAIFKMETPFETEAVCLEHLQPVFDSFKQDAAAGKIQFPDGFEGGKFRAGCYSLMDGDKA